MTKEKLTNGQKDLVLEALRYYLVNATQPDEECCGLFGRKKRTMNQAIDKIVRYS